MLLGELYDANQCLPVTYDKQTGIASTLHIFYKPELFSEASIVRKK